MYSLYEFNSEDLHKVVDNLLFKEGLRWAIHQGFFPCATSFRGTKRELNDLENLDRNEICDYVKDYPLPYISFCEDLEVYKQNPDHTQGGISNIQQDIETRQGLLNIAKTKYDVAWWTYVHACELQARFITLPMCKLLFPEKKFYVYQSFFHTVVLNAMPNLYIENHNKLSRDIEEPLVFDPISQSMSMFPDFEFFDIFSDKDTSFNYIIEEENILNQYIKSYGYIEIEEDAKDMKIWFEKMGMKQN